ncbi:MAG: ATP-binding protein, partial [Actinobacteria bacterium]|nr:ATP-binding protein [Actinomycetota bacterium]
LDVRRLKQGVHMLRRQSIDVGSLVVRLVGQADYLETREVRVETEPVVIAADETKVRRMVENLLTNAAKHTPEGTPVWVKVSAQPDGALISVEDAGPGIPDEDKASLFEEFTTGDAARDSATPGLGVGLSLVARFAELHGGRAWAEDRPDGGSAFRIFLPKDAPTDQRQ